MNLSPQQIATWKVQSKLLDSINEKSYDEPLTDDEELALLFYCGYTDLEDMEDLDCD